MTQCFFLFVPGVTAAVWASEPRRGNLGLTRIDARLDFGELELMEVPRSFHLGGDREQVGEGVVLASVMVMGSPWPPAIAMAMAMAMAIHSQHGLQRPLQQKTIFAYWAASPVQGASLGYCGICFARLFKRTFYLQVRVVTRDDYSS